MSITVIIIGDDPSSVQRSSASVQADPSCGSALVVQRPTNDTVPWYGVHTPYVSFLRAGDLYQPGACATLVEGLDEHAAVIGGHRVRGAGFWDVDVMPPPSVMLTPAAVAVDCSLELSALGVRREALPTQALPGPASPGGDVVLLATLMRAGLLASMPKVVVEVRLRPLHRSDPDDLLARWRGVLHSEFGEDPPIATQLRRRALSVAFGESATGVAASFDPDLWWGPLLSQGGPEVAVAIIRDLQSTAVRLAEAEHIQRIGFDRFTADVPMDELAEWISLPANISDLLATNATLHLIAAEQHATIRWLHEEVRLRDTMVAAQNQAIDLLRESERRRPVAVADMTAPTQSDHGGKIVEQSTGAELAKVVLRRARSRLLRLPRRGRS